MQFNSINDEYILEIQQFITRVTDNQSIGNEWLTLWSSINIFAAKMFLLQKKWLNYKKTTRINPIRVIKQDLDRIIREIETDILPNENPVEWGIRSAEYLINQFPKHLCFFKRTRFKDYINEISELLYAVVDRTKHSEVLKLLKEVKEHKDMVVIGQFFTNDIIQIYKDLCSTPSEITRIEIMNYITAYQKLCGIYEKDMILCYCLLQLRKTGYRDSYKDAHNDFRKIQHKINYVTSLIKTFGLHYDYILRNAEAHTNVEVDSSKQVVIIDLGENKQPNRYQYQTIISMVGEMCALLVAMRLLPVVLSRNDWERTGDILKYKI